MNFKVDIVLLCTWLVALVAHQAHNLMHDTDIDELD